VDTFLYESGGSSTRWGISEMSLEGIISEEDRSKLEALKAVPTGISDVEEGMFKMGNEGKTAFDAVGIFMGADDPEIDGMLQRTNFTSPDEVMATSQLLYLAKYGMRSAWLKGGPVFTAEWEISEIKNIVKWIIEGRPSVNGESRKEAKEAIQGIKVKLNTQQNPMSGL